jgi:CubicO group peptidase (beta-lactamase class C family)
MNNKIKRKAIIISFLAVVMVFFAFIVFLRPILQVAVGYAAKQTCNCYFLQGRKIEHIKKWELYSFPLNKCKIQINEEFRKVEASLFNLAKAIAVYDPYSACKLSYTHPNKNDIDTLTPMSDLEYQDVLPTVKSNTAILSHQLLDDFWQNFEDKDKLNYAFLVMHRDTLVYEYYADGINASMPMGGWSMAKSVTGLLIGIAIKQNLLDIEEKSLFDEWKKDPRAEITVKNLLQMNSGLRWNESYGAVSDVTTMLFLEDNAVEYASKKSLQNDVATHWSYASGTTNLLSGLLRIKISNDEAYQLFPYQSLFAPLGMKSAILELDNSGNFIGSSYLYANPYDWLKLGQFCLNNGEIGGMKFLPEHWLKDAITPAAGSNGKYGYQLWLNKNGVDIQGAPENMYAFHGYQGQRMYILPDEDLIILRFGTEKINFEKLVTGILEIYRKN